MKYLIIHDVDHDGWVSAWVTTNGLIARGFHDITHLGLLPGVAMTADMFEGFDRIVIVDLSPPRDLFAIYADKLTVIDHHKTSAWLKDYPQGVHDQAHSACMLCWMHFFPKAEAPKLVQYVEDRDIWKWRLPRSVEINAFLRVLGIESLDNVRRAANILANDQNHAETVGTYYLEYQNHQINNKIDQFDECIRKKQVMFWKNIPLMNVTENVSEVLHGIVMAKKLKYMGSFFYMQGFVIISLRSRNNFDVSEIAKANGGGGHAAAAGFRLSPQRFNEMIQFGEMPKEMYLETV